MSLSKVLKATPHRREVADTTQVIPVVEWPPDRDAKSKETVEGSVTNVCVERHAEELLSDATARAEQILKNAQEKAEGVMISALDEADKLRAEARTAGFNEGYQEGFQKAQEEMSEWQEVERASLTSLGESIIKQQTEHLHDLEPVIEQFSIACVRRLLKRELQLASVDVSKVVEELLQYVINGTSVQVRVHPDDYMQARQAQPKWQLQNYGKWSVTVVPDPSLSLGDCEILADAGRVDGRLHTRLTELEQALRDVSDSEGAVSDEGQA